MLSGSSGINNNDIAEELKQLILRIEATDQEMKQAIPRFREAYANCDYAREWQGQGLEMPQYLKMICVKGYNYFKNNISEPLLKSLLDYRDYLLGKKAYTGSFKVPTQGLLSSIHRYVVVTSFFGKNPMYIIPGTSVKELEYRKQFKDTIIETNMRLMGCKYDSNRKLNNFPIQNIAGKMGMQGDHEKILEYMKDQCMFLRTEILK